MKQVQKVMSGKTVEGAFRYLGDQSLLTAKGPRSVDEFLDLAVLEKALETRSA